MSFSKSTLLARANAAFRAKKYITAVRLYEQALSQFESPLENSIRFNLGLALRHMGKSSQTHSCALEKPPMLDEYYFTLIQKSGLFDPDWYLARYENQHTVVGNPLEHYLEHGTDLPTNPSPGFDTSYYLESNQDVAESGLHPFLHYVCQGIKEGRKPKPVRDVIDFDRFTVEEPSYIPRLSANVPLVETVVRVIAFYLPQFHVIPENNEWWGEGFTEWTNVKPAQQLFKGHYQPHVPDEALGYYDLSDTSVMYKQVELARQYGVEGFCFYVYWFGGKRLLEVPLENYLHDREIDFPFCICWANENWSRRWDGRDNEMLLVQKHSAEDDLAFIEEMAKYLRDPRYIRIEGKPLLIIYRPNLLPDMRKTAECWRAWCLANDIGEIYIAYAQSFERTNPDVYGLDAAIEFPPNNSDPYNITAQMELLSRGFDGAIYDWRVFVQRSENYQLPDYTLFRGVCPGWDNTARRKQSATVFANASPKLFEQWLDNVFKDTVNRFPEKNQRLVFVNAWNEWAEGAHLEPDRRHGYAWLEAVRQAHMANAQKQRRILIVSHDAHPHGAQLLCLNMVKYFRRSLGFKVDLIVLGEGQLLSKFAEYATVYQVNLATVRDKLDLTLSELKKNGTQAAIVNTTVSGGITPFLKEHGYTIVSLVHELPGVLSSYNLQAEAAAISTYADKIVFPARQVKDGFEAFVGHPLSKVVIRPQGLYQRSWLREGCKKNEIYKQVRMQLEIPADAKIILCAGYADHRKGFDLFVGVCAQLMRQRRDVYALWVGHADQGFIDSSLENGADPLIRDRFLFTGLIEEPQPYYLAADVYALTSREDPFPSVVLEAFDALTPVVGFKDCGGFEELIVRGCGILAAKDDVNGFSNAVLELLLNPDRALRMAQKGYEIVEREFDFRHYLFDLLDFGVQSFPRVSAIVPNYNYERYLEERLETVAAQTLPLYELLVLDDCSSDNSLTVIDKFISQCEIPSRVERSRANSGSVFRQWQKGVKLARGEYVWIAEADDVCKAQLIESIAYKMQATGAVFGFSDSWQIDANGQHLGDSYKSYVNTKNMTDFNQSFVMSGRDFLTKFLGVKNVILNVSAVVFRLDSLIAALESVGSELYNYKVAGDWRLYVELCKSDGLVVYEAASLNGHRRHGASVTRSLTVERHIAEVEKIQTLVGEIDSDEMLLAAQRNYLDQVKDDLNKPALNVTLATQSTKFS